MSDTKLLPEDLTSEERAIVEEMVTEYCPHISTEAWLETYEWALQRIEARRVLFAVAPEKVNTRCTHVGGLFSEEQRCIRESGHDGSHIYLNEKPAPEKAAKVETMADRIAADLKAGTFRGEQPAPPEPAAPVNGSTPVGEYDPDMKPAAREMPEAVRDALSFIRSIDRNWNKTSDQIADALEREWRNLAQPVAVGMTEELRMILDVAESRAEDQRHDGLLECSRNLERAIAAVRQQAAQGRKVELGKVRELVNDLKRALSEAAPSEMTMLDPHEWRSDLDAVSAELDAAEGKRRE